MPKLQPNEPVAILPITFTLLTFRNFIVRYLFNRDNIVYQFFTEDPALLEDAQMAGLEHKHKPFHPKFEDQMHRVFTTMITPADQLDISYIREFNSHCVIARGYAMKPDRDLYLEDLLHTLDNEIDQTDAATPASPANTAPTKKE